MLGMCRELGFAVEIDRDDPAVHHVRLPLTAGAAA
jgi:hypothetical protein